MGPKRGQRSSGNDEDDDSIDIITLNSNSWATGQGVIEWLHRQEADPDVLCLQETRVKLSSGLASASAWARSRGFDLAGDLAASTGPGATQSSAGVAIAVRHNVPAGGF